jgi:hypothetical protein
MREAKMKALQERKCGCSGGGECHCPMVITERGGRKRDKKKMLGSYQQGSLADVFGSVLSKSRGVEKPAAQVPPGMDERLSLLYRQVMNSPATMAGLGVGLARGAEFGVGPSGSIEAQFEDPTGMVDPQTLGDVMLIPKRFAKSAKIREHELGHVRQGRFFGPFLPAASGVAAALKGYEGSPFEGEAAFRSGRAEAEALPSYQQEMVRLLTR